MKKWISLVCVILLLASFCTLAVSAGGAVVVVADDFNSLVYDGDVYVRVENGDGISYSDSASEVYVALTKRQKKEIREVEAIMDVDRNAYVELTVYYKTATSGHDIVYIKESRLDEYNAILDGFGDQYTTYINYDSPDEIIMSKDQLMGESFVRDGDEIPHTNTFTVWVESEDGSFCAVAGEIMIVGPEDEYYYLDYFQKGNDGYYDLMNDLGSCEDVTLYRITDAALIERIEMDYAAFYDAQMLPYTEDVGKVLSAAMMVVIFGVVPLALVVVGIIGWIRSKRGLYRRLFASMVFVGAAEIAVFVTACIVCVINQ